ncbi:DUF998 domain-containing protein [Aeromicrobium duanguangcaii]|uniref:DUF998 domain-containing protein n=1 Tax=Aeromicrobium duanguangcaii TaxID=2968086 RepID=A0ABY5KBM3_9ACTN|nr:DUF998 domain-containing protein [Aeromicrobium duanguangcaii]MCD9154912.1 DUF998 domain-containing protein [Aeromicrobium duanguangcaii]UUI67679.1 DUF998 domain-containing protein [Aeromicrobium duanguangcaii]
MRMRPVACLAIGTAAALLYSNFLIDWVLRGFADSDLVVSYLETPGEPNSGLLRITNVVCAALVILLLPSVRRALPPGWAGWAFVVATALFAAGAVGAAIVPMPCGLGEDCISAAERRAADIHDVFSTLSETALFVGVAAVWWDTRRVGPAWVARIAWWLFWLAGVASTAVFTYYGLFTDHHAVTAYSQRVHILGVSLWLACLGVVAARSAASIGRGPGDE